MEELLIAIEHLLSVFAIGLVIYLCRSAYEQGKYRTAPSDFWGLLYRFTVWTGPALAMMRFINDSDKLPWARLFGAMIGSVLLVPVLATVCVIPWLVGRVQRVSSDPSKP